MANTIREQGPAGEAPPGDPLAAVQDDNVWLKAVFEASPDAIFVEDLEGRVLDVNPAACRLHGMDRESLVGKSVLDLVPEVSRGKVRAEFRKWVNGEVTCCEGESLGPGGKAVPVEIRASRIVYKEQHAVLFMVRDISRRRTTEGQHARAEKMEALGKLAGGMAHDFNNLLMVIMNNATFVREELPPDSPAHEDLDQLTQAANEAASLTGQLLCFSRKQMFSPKPVDLVRLVKDACAALRQRRGRDP